MIKKIQKNMNKKGFTLVELIIVLAVMAILAAIVIPRMSGLTDSFKIKADEQACENIANEITARIMLEGTDTDDDTTIIAPGPALVSSVVTMSADEAKPSTNDAHFFMYEYSGTTLYVYVASADDAAHGAGTVTSGTLVTRTDVKKVE